MSSNITNKMKSTPLKLNAYETCLECSDFINFKNLKSNELDADAYNGMRIKCMDCQKHIQDTTSESKTVYKFDAIYSAVTYYENKEKTFKRNVGKKSTVARRYGNKIDERLKAGKSQRQIAEELGISRSTIHKYLKNKNATL